MSCLFQSLGQAVGRSPEDLRADVCKYLLSQPPPVLVEGLSPEEVVRSEFPERSLEEYVEAMRNPAEFGGAVEIRAFVHMSGMAVKVETGDGRSILFPAAASGQRTVVVRWESAHFEYLRTED